MDVAAPLLGRDEDLARLAGLVRPGRVVTVTGPGGVGKTTLVDRFAANGGTRTGQMITASLVELEQGADAASVSQQLGFASPEAAGVALSGDPALVVLDNCEHVVAGVATFVAAVLAQSATTAVLATSREPLHVPGEQVLVLAPLAVPATGAADAAASPAVRLFLERAAAAGAAWADTDPAAVGAVAELCRRLDGLPLAIEIAAARARAVGPVELLRLMEHRLDLLRGPDPVGSSRPDRHHSVRAAIDVSVELLAPDEATSMRRLGVFAGPFDLDLAHAVIGSPDGSVVDTVDLLTRLVDRSLVEVSHVHGSARYRLLELVREHAREASVLAGHWDDTRRRFVAAMDAVAEHIVVEALVEWRGEVLAEATTQFRNLVSAIEWAVELDDTPDRALRLMRPMLVSVHQGRSSDVLDVGGHIFERWPTDRAPWRGEVLGVMATAASVVADVSGVERLAHAALADPDGTAVASVLAERALALTEIGLGRSAKALEHVERGRAAAREAGLHPFLRELTGIDLAVRQMLGRSEGVMEEVVALIEESRLAGDAVNEALALLVRSQVLAARGAFDDAEEAVDQADRVTESGGYAWWTRAVLRARAELAATRAESVGEDPWLASAPRWRRATDLAIGTGALGELATTLLAAAVVASRAGATDAAATLVRAAPPVVELTVIPDTRRADVLAVVAASAGVGDPPATTLSGRLAEALAVFDAAMTSVPSESAGGAPGEVRLDRSAEMRAEGDTWVVTYAGRSARIGHRKGLADLAVLLAAPGTDVHCLQLMGGTDVGGGSNAGIDNAARRTYEARIVELQGDIDDARAANDVRRAELAELELDALVAQLSESLGLGGRARATGSAAERARSAVTARIRAAVKRIGEDHPELARHLTNAVKTGTWCVYAPEADVTWTVVPPT